MTRRRTLLVLVGALLAALLAATPALAAPLRLGDLEEYLRAAAEADYAGTQIVVTVFEGETTAALVGVEQAEDMMLLAGDYGAALVGGGKVAAGDAGSIAISDWTRLGESSRYTAVDAVPVRRLGRDAESVSIMEGELLRARIVFDTATGAPLTTEVLDGDGDVFRLSTMVRFDPTPPRSVYERVGADAEEYVVMVPIGAEGMPLEIAGYRLGDRYAGPDEVRHSFYSDGLFSFSLFELDGRMDASRFDEAATLELGGARYQVLVTPAELWVQWHTADAGYVLVGDLPPDHLTEVLTELPRPQRRNLLSRIWRGIFG